MSNKVLKRAVDPPPQKAKGMVHKLVADTAKGLAKEHYDQLALNNRFYKAHPNVEHFSFRKWPLYVDMARQILTEMLNLPQYDQATKDLIADALFKDGAVNPKRMAEPAKPVITFSNLKKEAIK